ncbi:membrane protein [Photobacterium sanctipauli]|uniref:membrane protein n=1 Tax=Photobacterium sanctipauli TaxID=1342794 RepID=UPI00055C1E2A|nr:membrane protein [Photobacterium sanctipauli]
MNNKTFHVGGSVDKAIKGESELQSLAVLQEAWRITAKNFLTFLPAVIGLFLAQVALLLLALQVQLGSAATFFDAIIQGGEISAEVVEAGYMANYWSDILSAPLYAGVSLMALNHAVGLPSKPSHLVKGFPFTIVSIITVLLTSSLQGIGNAVFPILGLLLSMGFSMAIILVCEKRISPLKAIQYSLMATLRKLLPMTAIFIVIMTMFIVSFATAGIGLIWTIPFFFNAKAIIYRNLFGITLQVTTVKKGGDEEAQTDSSDSKVFDA